MKIVDRKTLLDTPNGTLYADYSPSAGSNSLAFGSLRTKLNNTGEMFEYMPLFEPAMEDGFNPCNGIDICLNPFYSLPAYLDSGGRVNADARYAVFDNIDIVEIIMGLADNCGVVVEARNRLNDEFC